MAVIRDLLALHPYWSSTLIQEGAISAVCLHLGFVLNRPQAPECEEALRFLCSALNFLFEHCHDDLMETSVREIGEDVIHLTTQTFLVYRSITEGSDSQVVPDRNGMEITVLSIWKRCSGCLPGAILMARSQTLMDMIVEVLATTTTTTSTHTTINNAIDTRYDAIDLALAIVKHITHFAEDDRMRILENQPLLNALLGIDVREGRPNQRLSAIFRNLSLSPNVRLVLVQCPSVLSTLVRLCQPSHSNRVIRNVLSTFDSLAMDGDSAVALVLHGDGIVLQVLARLVAEHSDETARHRATRALRLLARQSATPLLVHDDTLMETLLTSGLHDENEHVRVEAAEAFASCASILKSSMAGHAEMLHSLTRLVHRNPAASESIAKALHQQAGYPGNKQAMAENRHVLEALATIAVREGLSVACKVAATSALHELSSASSVRGHLVTGSVLQALTHTAHDRSETVRNHAMSTLLNLATLDSNRKVMVSHAGLLQSLVQYVATSTDNERKKTVKKTILKLVPLL